MQQEKEEKERILEEAVRRMEGGLPPTENCEKEWERIERNRLRS